MKINRDILLYSGIIALSALTVSVFAFIQYRIIQGQELIFSNFIVPVIVGILFGAMISRIIDLSKRSLKLTRRLRRERDIINEKNKKIRDFTNTIVHDLKSPIAAINSLSEMVLSDEFKSENEKMEYLGLIHTSSSDVLENISLIIDKTRIEDGIKEDQLEVGNPYYTIQAVIDKYTVSALSKSISIQRLIENKLPNVRFDKVALDHSLSNIISNAIKFSPVKTQVKIYHELLADRLKIIVEDQGLGMTEEEIKNAFDDHNVISSTPTGVENSLGHSLPIVKQLVEQMGGTITVRSEGKNKGSSFEFSLKLDVPEEE